MVQTLLVRAGSRFLRLFVWIPGSQFVCLGQVLEAYIKTSDDLRGWLPAEFQEQFSFTVEFKMFVGLDWSYSQTLFLESFQNMRALCKWPNPSVSAGLSGKLYYGLFFFFLRKSYSPLSHFTAMHFILANTSLLYVP